MTRYTSVDEYIRSQEDSIAQRLTTIRTLFHDILPDTQESIRYQIPAFTVGKDHLYISAYKNHIGMYPMYGIPELDKELLPYRGKGTKDSLHFKHTEPLPLELIEKIIRTKSKLGKS
jgi:uncharacterized protein YdhG (YjbR/CyaY superfamily)